MTRKILLCLAFCLNCTRLQGAEPHPACNDTTYDWLMHSAAELRRLAAGCRSPRFSELNFHRAYFRDLVTEGNATASLIDYAPSESRANFGAYVVHMLLMEQLARHYYPTTAGQLLFLNSEYEINNEIAELWLRGYNNLALRLSEMHSRQEAPQ